MALHVTYLDRNRATGESEWELCSRSYCSFVYFVVWRRKGSLAWI